MDCFTPCLLWPYLKNPVRMLELRIQVTVKESRAIRGEIYALEDQMQNDIARKDNEIQRLKDELEFLAAEPTKKGLTAEEILSMPDDEFEFKENNKLGQDQLNILKAISVYSDEVPEKELVDSAEGGHVKAKYNLEELEKLGYVEREFSQGLSDYGFTLTHKAREFLVKHEHV